ncbi:hypothetical protein [Altericroceibacterium endophyticum]|uniref:Sugar transporter n=1 Tax=Altericroceibacterium endophyticum TaxID=1808508 RepID=A0A6I4T203_9SPHN|nr:hypothetical protein [Altericroceibacterium endophyticum]MXO64936.1 hypothetical protein [Altericroceibacterium endophyticum]
MTQQQNAPWHLWVVGIVSLLWNVVGAYDYWITRVGSQRYLQIAGVSRLELIWLANMPWWVDVAWACGVWGSIAGSLLLLLRRKLAATAFLLAVLGMLATNFYRMTSDAPPSMTGTAADIISLVLILIAGALTWYAVRMRRAAVLR